MIDTELAIRKLDYQLQNPYRYITYKILKQIGQSEQTNASHKRDMFIIKHIRQKLRQHNLVIVPADKGKTTVIIERTQLQQKVSQFLNENEFHKLKTDPTNKFQSLINKLIHNSGTLIGSNKAKFLTQIKPVAPRLNAKLKLHKDNIPIRPVINNIGAPTHKIAKFMKEKLHEIIQPKHTYTLNNSALIAHFLNNLKCNKNTRLMTADIKDLYVNIPIKETINIINDKMKANRLDTQLRLQTINILEAILSQNYFQWDDSFYQPNKGVAMGSPISAIIAEIFLQQLEDTYIKHWLDSKSITYYARYVDDIFIIYDLHKTNGNQITNNLNKIHHNLTFKPTYELNKTINFLDLTISRNDYKLNINIFRKPTTTDGTIHFTSNHPMEHKISAYQHHLERAWTLPLTTDNRRQEINTIKIMAENNGFPQGIITQLMERTKKKLATTNIKKENNSKPKKWTTFTYHSPLVRKITNVFKNTNLNIAFKATNTASQLLRINNLNGEYEKSGVYTITCPTCKKAYVGQTGRSLNARFKEHMRYVKTSNPKSAIAQHIISQQHEVGSIEETMRLLKTCNKSHKLNCWENYYIQTYRDRGKLIPEQNTIDTNLLYTVTSIQQPDYNKHERQSS